MKIYRKKNQPGYLILSNVKIRSFDYIWNPKKEEIITKEHLKLYLEKAFMYNFLFFKAPWLRFYLDEKCYTSSSRVLSIYCRVLVDYCLEVDEPLCYKNSSFYPYFLFLFDSREVYKKFAHLISPERFSEILKYQINEAKMFPFSYEDDFFNFFFVSSNKQKEELLGEEYFIKDQKVWEEALENAIEVLEDFCGDSSVYKINFEKDIKEPMLYRLEEDL